MRVPASCLTLVLVAGVLASDPAQALADAAYDAGMSALSSTFSSMPGSPNGRYDCRTIDVMHPDQTILLGTMVVTPAVLLGTGVASPGHYSASGIKWAAGTWSGNGHLHFSGQPLNTALAEYGANRAGRSSIRFVWNPKSQPAVWICTR